MILLYSLLFLLSFEIARGKIYPANDPLSPLPEFGSLVINNIINGTDIFPVPFYARLMFLDRGERMPFFCGATIIGQVWIMTAAKCVSHFEQGKNSERYTISVEVSQMNQKNWVPMSDRRFRVSHIFTAPNHNYALNTEDIALLRLAATTRLLPKFRPVPLCSEPVNEGSLLGTCGLGSISRDQLVLPSGLKEARLRTSEFRFDANSELVFCPYDQICAYPSEVASDSNICYMDEGNPLYKFNCSTGLPECVIGVASHYAESRFDNISDSCKGGSYFASVPNLYNWITSTMEIYS